MKAFVKLHICIAVGALQILTAQAQLFHPKDSVRKYHVLQVGLGGFTGVNKVIPTTGDFFYGTADGLEYGALANLYVNISKQFVMQTGFRLANRIATISHGNYAFYESFDLALNVAQIPLFITYNVYNKTTNLFDVGIGVAYNQINMNSTNIYYNQHPPGVGLSSITGSDYINYNNTMYGSSIFFNVTKTFGLINSTHLALFSEFEWVNPRIETLNRFVYGPTPSVNFWTNYQTYLYRVGLIIKI